MQQHHNVIVLGDYDHLVDGRAVAELRERLVR